MDFVRTHIKEDDFRGVLPVPPLARRGDPRRTLDFGESEKIVRHMAAGGLTRFLYGGNAFLYHLTLAEYEATIDWLADLSDDWLVIPSAGPSYGRAMDQAPLLRKHRFPYVMLLPCGDPRDARGIEQGYREFADAIESKLIVYLKEESNMGGDKEAGLDAVVRLMADGVCAAVKYAVVRPDPNQDAYLRGLIGRVARERVISGMGERPAVTHMRDWSLPGFTTGSGCVAPAMSAAIHRLCAAGDFTAAEKLRAKFMPLEDLRDAWGPARVLHQACELAGIAKAGPIAPYVTGLNAAQLRELEPVAQTLIETDRRFAAQGIPETVEA